MFCFVKQAMQIVEKWDFVAQKIKTNHIKMISMGQAYLRNEQRMTTTKAYVWQDNRYVFIVILSKMQMLTVNTFNTRSLLATNRYLEMIVQITFCVFGWIAHKLVFKWHLSIVVLKRACNASQIGYCMGIYDGINRNEKMATHTKREDMTRKWIQMFIEWFRINR